MLLIVGYPFTVEYADLPIIDLSQGDTTKGRADLASQVCKAMTTQGFFYVINHGYTAAQVGQSTVRRDENNNAVLADPTYF